MIDAAIKALQQMFSAPFRSVLIKSVLLALVMIVLIGVGLHKGLSWLTQSGSVWAEAVEGRRGRSKHPKSALQEWAAGNRRKPPEYEVLDRSGPDHNAHFTVRVRVLNVGEVEASGSSKQAAETAAAKAFMEQYG